MRKLLSAIAAAVAVFATLALPASPASASREIFCQRGYHRVMRHGHEVCIRNHHHDRDHDRD